jgi:hypothetical protein
MLLQIGPGSMGQQLAAAGVVDEPCDGAAMVFTADPAIVAELLARQVRQQLQQQQQQRSGDFAAEGLHQPTALTL